MNHLTQVFPAQPDSPLVDGNGQSFFIATPNDLKFQFLKDIPWDRIEWLRGSCESLRNVIDSWEFFIQYFSRFEITEIIDEKKVYSYSFDFHAFPNHIPLGRMISIWNRYLTKFQQKFKDEPKIIRELNFENFFSLQDQNLKNIAESLQKLNLKVKTLSLQGLNPNGIGPGILSFIKAQCFDKQANISIQSPKGLINDLPLFTDDVLSELLKQKISLRHLSLTLSANISPDILTKFIKGGGLQSPCHLSFNHEILITDEIVEALIKSQIKISNLDVCLGKIAANQLIKLIKGGCLISPCQLKLGFLSSLENTIEHVELGKEFFQALTDQKIQLSKLCTCSYRINQNAFYEFILKGGLTPSVDLDIPDLNLDEKMVEALSKHELQAFNFSFEEHNTSLKHLERLIKNGKWSTPCHLNLNRELNQQSIKVLEAVMSSKLQTNQICIDQSEYSGVMGSFWETAFTADSFCDFVSQGKLLSPCILDFTKSKKWLNSRCLTRLAKSHIKIQSLLLPAKGNVLDHGILALCKEGSFVENSPVTLSLPSLGEKAELVLTEIAKIKVCGLILNLANFKKKAFLKLFKDKENFSHLTLLAGQSSDWWQQDKDKCINLLKKYKPNLTVFLAEGHALSPTLN